jgi:hypothetical protein
VRLSPKAMNFVTCRDGGARAGAGTGAGNTLADGEVGVDEDVEQAAVAASSSTHAKPRHGEAVGAVLKPLNFI